MWCCSSLPQWLQAASLQPLKRLRPYPQAVAVGAAYSGAGTKISHGAN
jgi:hypothetical protein